MNFTHLQAFYTVVSCNGFTRAAERTHKAQSAFSAQVALLERDLGVKLYEVVARRLRLTAAGQRLYEGIAPFFHGISDLRRSVRDPEEGELAIASTQNNLLHRLRAPLERLRARYPRVRLRLITIDNHQALDRLRAGDADVAVVRTPSDIPPDVEAIALPATTLVLIAPRDHPIAARAQVTPADIAAHPLIAFHPGDWLRQHCNRVFQSHGCTPNIVVEAATAEVVKAYVTAGFGLAIIGNLDFVAAREPDPRLHVRDVAGYFGRDLTTALLPRGRFRPPYLRMLLELLQEETLEPPRAPASGPDGAGGGREDRHAGAGARVATARRRQASPPGSRRPVASRRPAPSLRQEVATGSGGRKGR